MKEVNLITVNINVDVLELIGNMLFPKIWQTIPKPENELKWQEVETPKQEPEQEQNAEQLELNLKTPETLNIKEPPKRKNCRYAAKSEGSVMFEGSSTFKFSPNKKTMLDFFGAKRTRLVHTDRINDETHIILEESRVLASIAQAAGRPIKKYRRYYSMANGGKLTTINITEVK